MRPAPPRDSAGRDYPKNYVMTSGCELAVKVVPLPGTSVHVELFLFDCPGQSVFNTPETLHAAVWENASMLMVV